ncbi:MAG TPA: hypothetical protein VFC47_07215 [Caulobacteraceae bacterium]|nr:hypothetical protein [Caulobacteraceae bacterium]
MKSDTTAPSHPGRPPRLVSDRWVFWPALATTAVVASLALLCGLPGLVSFILIPTSLLGYLVATIALVVTAAVLAVKKLPRKATSVLLALGTPILLWGPINWAAQCIHLGLTVGFGAGVLGPVSRPAGSEFAAYDWSTGLAGGPSTFLIYDKSDEMALPLSARSAPRMCSDMSAPVV